MPPFFVPNAKDDAQAEEIWEATHKHCEEQIGGKVSDRRIFSLAYVHDGVDRRAEVGQQDEPQGEQVLVILEANTFLVCTANRGVALGFPILVGKDEAEVVVDFD